MNEGLWSKMPISWQTDPDFHMTIRQAPVGDAIAALKLYIGICLKANFKPKEGLPLTGCVKLSLTRLCELADLSRPMVVAGLKLLKKWELVESLGGRPSIYHVIDYDTAPNWTKLPRRPLYGSHKDFRMIGLEGMPNRGAATLRALQLFLYLASVRDKKTYRATVSYEQISKVLGISRNRVSAAISMLSAELITVRTPPMIKKEEGEKHLTNYYWLRGSLHDPLTEGDVGIKQVTVIPNTGFVQILKDLKP